MQGPPQPLCFYGIDVAKSELVIAAKDQAGTQTIPNKAQPISAWLEKIPQSAVIAVESTGRFHRLVVELAAKSGRQAFVLNAMDSYHYAKGVGGRSKTDRVDAHVIARYIAEHHRALFPWQPEHPQAREIWDLIVRRAEITKARASLRQSLSEMAGIDEAAQAFDAGFDALLEAIDTKVQRLQQESAQLQELSEQMQTIKGVGPQGGAMLSALFHRFEFKNADALVAYSGLDPRANDSGQKRGRRRLSKKGPPPLRRQAYLMAKAATRSPIFKPMYEALKQRGLATTQAIVVLARKILRIAYAMWKSGQAFDAKHFLPTTA